MMKEIQLHHGAPKRRWDDRGSSLYLGVNPFPQRFTGCASAGSSANPALPPSTLAPADRKLLVLSSLCDDVASTVVPPVTVVLDGRSICHRIYLHKHDSYESFAKGLRRILVDPEDAGGDGRDQNGCQGLDLSNVVPGYMVAYEDMEDDLLLAGDLNWKDFVRVAKRIRIIPAKTTRRKQCGGS